MGQPFAAGASSGTVRINVAPPTGYTIALGQANPVIASVMPGQVNQVTVLVAKAAP
ncbi:MAG: hypothetical protein ACR2M1_17695 [Gemmatimonadaceae bacterium]